MSEKKNVLITGASRGIGRATALRFARGGFNLIINSKSGGFPLDSLKEEILSLGSECLAVKGDVGDSDFVHAMAAEGIGRFGSIDVLVNNAGISYIGLIQDMSREDWQRILNTNLSSVHYCSQAVIPHMLRSQSGHIINVSSVWGNRGASCEVAYSATKGGINAYTKALAKELAPSGISVNAVAFGFIDTDMNKGFDASERTALFEEIPSGRPGTPEEAAELIYSLANQSPYFTGQIVTLDGGWTV